MSRNHVALDALQRICKHKLADPAGTLVIVKAHGKASITCGPGPASETTFPLNVAEYDTLINWGYLRQSQHAVRSAHSRTAFEITDDGWAKFRERVGSHRA